jgi:hypothetical protein
MKNNLNTNIFKRFWSYFSKMRYEKNLNYTEYKKTSPLWKYRLLKIGTIISFYGIGHYMIYTDKTIKDDFNLIEQLNELVNKNPIINDSFDKFFKDLKNQNSNYYNIDLINNKESNLISQIAKSLDPNVEKYIKVMKVDKLLSDEEHNSEAKETIQKLE